MPQVYEIVKILTNRGIKLRVIDDRLNVKAPSGVMTSELQDLIRENRDEIVELFKGLSGKFEIDRATKRSSYPLSSAQRRMYILYEFDRDSVTYNIPQFIRMRGNLSVERLESSFRQLLSRHEVFRTTFGIEGDEAVQYIHDHVAFTIDYYKGPESSVDSLVSGFIRPFDLSLAPLFRVGLIKVGPEDHLLMFDTHHIISDGVSRNILVNEFISLYNGELLPELSLHYKDYAVWQQNDLQQESLSLDKSYWLNLYASPAPLLDLPTDYERPMVRSQAGATFGFEITAEVASGLRDLSGRTGATMYMTLLSIYGILLSKLSNQEDMVIGTPTSGRMHADLDGMVGMFVNTLALRLEALGDLPYEEFLVTLKTRVLSSFDHQAYQYEELIDALHIVRDTSRNPLFDVMFTYEHQDTSTSMELSGLELSSYEQNNAVAKFDLMLSVLDEGDRLGLAFTYSTSLFSSATIEHFSNYFNRIVNEVVSNSQVLLSQVDMIPEIERQELLEVFNSTEAVYPSDQTLVTLFEAQVSKIPDKVAVVHDYTALSYLLLNQRSNQLANYLRDKQGVAEGSVIGLMFSRSPEMLIGILGILKSGCSYVPLDDSNPKERNKYILDEVGAVLLLTNAEDIMSYGEFILSVDIDTIDLSSHSDVDLGISHSSSSVCYILYTSGSTGKPKGVMVTHGSVVNLIYSQKKEFLIDTSDRIFQFSTITFDASVEQVWLSLLSGSQLILADKELLLSGEALNLYLNTQKVTHFHTTPSFLENFSALDSSYLKRLVCGGEECSVQLAHRYCERYDFYNKYGPTEATVTSTLMRVPKVGIKTSYVSIGRPIDNTCAYILDASLNLLPKGVKGELYLGGAGLAHGYVNDPGLTSERFIENPYNKGTKIYRTGDMVRWSDDGTLEFLGRIDHQVKLRGFRIELGEIRYHLMSHTAVGDCLVLSRLYQEEDCLVAYYTSSEVLDHSELRKYLSEGLPGYMVPQHYVRVESFVLTSNGKINRSLLPLPEMQISKDHQIPATDLEEVLAGLWSEVLKIERNQISVTRSFFELGGHSLRATILVNKISKVLQVSVNLRNIFAYQDIRSLAGFLETSSEKIQLPVLPKSDREYYPLSSAQLRMYILYEFDRGSVAYNMPQFIRMQGDLSVDRLESSFRELLRRHEVFQTSFGLEGDQAVQYVHDDVAFTVDFYEGSESSVDDLVSGFIRPFDLSRAPLLRVGLIKIGPKDNMLMFDTHHIISDGVSRNILMNEFISLYNGELLPELTSHYKDYAVWQQNDLQQEASSVDKSYWLDLYESPAPLLDLPTDYERPLVRSQEGAFFGFEITGEEAKGLRELSGRVGATMYMTLLSIYGILLSKLSNQEDMVIGTPTSGRMHADLEEMVGMFVNTLALRLEALGDLPYEEFLVKLKTHVLSSFDHQAYQYEELIDALHVARDTSRNPLFDAMFTYNHQGTSTSMELAGLELSAYDQNNAVAKFDLMLSVLDRGDRLGLVFTYSTSLFSSATIERFVHYFNRIVHEVISNSSVLLSQIDIIPEIERQELLEVFNSTEVVYPSDQTVVTLFEAQVTKNPDNIALRYMDEALTYQELDENSNKVANYLQQDKKVKTGDFVGLLLPRDEHLIIWIFGILKTGATYIPIDTKSPGSRICSIIDEAGLKILITRSEYKAKITQTSCYVLDFEDAIEVIRTMSSNRLGIKTKTSDLAYVIYTSGSTGKPKGVAVEHCSLSNILHHMQFNYPLHGRDSFLLKTAYTFDVSVAEIFGWFLQGGSLTLLPTDTEQDPLQILATIEKNNVTHINFVPSAFSAFVACMESNGIEKISSLKYIFLAGEELPAELVSRFNLLGTSVLLTNIYGPTEATIYSSAYTLKSIEDTTIIPIGKPLSNIQLYVLDKDKTLVPKGVKGELYIGGAGLTRGYVNDPDLTSERFIENPYSLDTRVYRTGDMARWLDGGNIEYLGRIDDQVKLRGFRIELGEIRYHLMRHPDVEEGLVLSRFYQEEDCLVAYYTSSEVLDHSGLRQYLTEVLPGYMVPMYYVQVELFVLTSNGKVDRSVLPLPEMQIGEDHQTPTTDLEKALTELWSEVLKIERDQISVTRSFFELGGHSLRATILVNKISKALQVGVNLRDIFAYQDIRSLAGFLETSSEKVQLPLLPTLDREYYPLSSAQLRMYILYEFDRGSVAYNMPQFIRMKGDLSAERLESSFNELLRRHEVFRTSFGLEGDQAVQYVHESVTSTVTYYDGSEASVDGFISEFTRPFDLNQAPLFRVGLIKIGPEDHMLMFDIHHIINDGISNRILVNEFISLYNRELLQEQSLHYKDYAVWQQSDLQQESLSIDKSYWLDLYASPAPLLDLPTDYERPLVRSQEGATFGFEITGEETRGLRELSVTAGATMYMTLLSIYGILLSKLSNQEDMVIGTPTSGRMHADLEGMVGMFVNTLALRLETLSGLPYEEFLVKLKTRVLSSFDHQAYQYEELIDALHVARDTSRNPLFDVMFTYDHQDKSTSMELTGLKLSPYDQSNAIAKFDLNLSVLDRGDRLGLVFTYSTSLFGSVTIERFARYFSRIVSEVVSNSKVLLSQIDMIPEIERQELLEVFNSTEVVYPSDQTVVTLFEEQVTKTPDKVALRYKDKVLTYRELNERSNSLARSLNKKGVTSNNIVGILLEPCLEMLIGLLGIVKSGAAFLPIDPSYPEQRVTYTLEDSGHKLLLSVPHIIEKLGYKGEYLDISDPEIFDPKTSNLSKYPSSHDTAYLIYTSGSTGFPKGVLIEHHSLVNLCQWHNTSFKVSANDNSTKYAGFGFDASVWEIFPYMIVGATIHIIEESLRLDLESLNQYYEAHNITISFLPTQVCEQFTRLQNNSLRYLLTGGEQLSGIGQTNYKVINNYGPTESTVVATSYELSGSPTSIPIGSPIHNTRVYILDASLNLLPKGVKGELYIGGAGLAKGYINDPDLTAERFIDNPYRVGTKIYHTGDMARWLDDGTLAFLGRVDDQVKLRGFRIELGEIRYHLMSHTAVVDCLVLSRFYQGEDYLVAYYTSSEVLDHSELREYLSGGLPGYMVPQHYVRVESFVLTSNGKIDRSVLPLPEMQINDDHQTPTTDLEMALAGLWSEVLKIERDQISVTTSFFELGGHSLRATVLVNKISKVLQVGVSLRDIFAYQDIRSLAGFLETSSKEIQLPILPTSDRDYYPLSSAQRRMYILYEFDRGSVAYNIPEFIRMRGDLSVERLESSFGELFSRHEVFRTSFSVEGDEAVQYVHEEVVFAIDFYEGPESSVDDLVSGFIRPFDLNRAPLLRVGLIKIGPEDHMLMFDIHHIINDAVSRSILVNEFMSLYNEVVLPNVGLHYKDYAVWQQADLQLEALSFDKSYWLDLYANPAPLLDLLTDYERPLVRSEEGATFGFELSGEEHKGLQKLSEKAGATMYMTLLSIYGILLSKLSNQEDIVIGTPTSGRMHADLEGMLGMFVNTLALPLKVVDSLRYDEHLLKLKALVLNSFDHQRYQYEELIDALHVARDTSRNPLFDVMFTYNHQDTSTPMELTGLELSPYEQSSTISKFDLTLSAHQLEKGLFLNFEYSTKLFSQQTIIRFTTYFKKIVTTIISNSEIKLSEIDILSNDEREELIIDFNDTAVDYPKASTITSSFEEQVSITPNNIALVLNSTQITYKNLNEKANQFAHYLRSKGVKESSVIGLMLDRSIEVIIGIIGILKAGGTYLPLDISQPDKRISHLLKESQALLLVTNEHKKASFEKHIETVDIGEVEINGMNKNNLEIPISSSNVAYIIYTSGSTGSPKGVMVGHQSVINLIYSQKEMFGVDDHDRILQFSNIVFDASVEQIWLALLSGSTLVLISKEDMLDGINFQTYITNHNVTHLDVTPSFLESIGSSFHKDLKRIVVGGEDFNVRTATRLFKDYKLYNAYGPTEATVTSIQFLIQEAFTEGTRIPIGRPINNTCVYILDSSLSLLPKGVKGELYIGGEGLALGYINDLKLTSERFVENPYGVGSKIYRTGDMARWLPEGTLEFLGRADEQVKIRGFRIELGEIEHQLLSNSRVKEVIVVAKGEDVDKYLVVYYVSEREFESGEIRNYLSDRLPDYMVPSSYVHMERLPLTSSGKVDKRSLPEPELKQGDDYKAPDSETEKRLTELWSEVLKIESDQISVTTSFFELGGHSLRATILVNKINKSLRTEVPLKEIFKSPTIRLLSKKISEIQVTTPTGVEDLILLDRGLKTDKNLFFIHDGSGDVQGYVELSTLVHNYNCWGIRSTTLNQFGPVNLEIKEIALDYIQKIKMIQPTGPYNVAGWSTGGVIAFEIVSQLESSGEDVEALFIIDSIFDHTIDTDNPESENRFMLEDEKVILSKMFEIDSETLENFTGGINELWGMADEITEEHKLLDIRNQVPKEFHPIIPNFNHLDLKSLIKYVNTIRTLQHAKSIYRPNIPAKLNSQLIYIGATETNYNIDFLSAYFENQIVYIAIEGDHFSILNPPKATELAALVDTHLNHAEIRLVNS